MTRIFLAEAVPILVTVMVRKYLDRQLTARFESQRGRVLPHPCEESPEAS